MSRHRSPGGRYAPPRPETSAVALSGVRGTQPARHRALSESAVRNGMSAAAAAGGVLAVVVPAVAVTPLNGIDQDRKALAWFSHEIQRNLVEEALHVQ